MVKYEINEKLNGIEIWFSPRPENEVLETLKGAGFRWHRMKKLWYAKQTPERLELAKSLSEGGKTVAIKTKNKENKLVSLWNRCKTDDISRERNMEIGGRYCDTKAIAAETRKHIKERFPEIKFSCRIGSGGWASANEVNFYFKQSPYEKDSVYFEAIRDYVKAWLWSFNYDNSDLMTDYFDRGFYEEISTWDYEVVEPTEAQLQDMADFDKEMEKAEEEKRAEEERKYQEYLKEQEEQKKLWEERERIAKAKAEEINDNVEVKDLDEKYVLEGEMLCGIGKECSLAEVREEGRRNSKKETVLIKREIHFSDERIYDNFCEMFLYDWEFLAGFGGTGTFDERVTDENIQLLTTSQRSDVKWILWDCVAVFLNGELKLVIDPEGYSYARYVNEVVGELTRTTIEDEEKEGKDKPEFHFPEPVAEQAEGLEVGKTYSMIKLNPWTLMSERTDFKLEGKELTSYAQYKNSLRLRFTIKGKRNLQECFIHDGSETIIIPGEAPSAPADIAKRIINENMYEDLTSGMNAKTFLVNMVRFYEAQDIKPVINTLQY